MAACQAQENYVVFALSHPGRQARLDRECPAAQDRRLIHEFTQEFDLPLVQREHADARASFFGGRLRECFETANQFLGFLKVDDAARRQPLPKRGKRSIAVARCQVKFEARAAFWPFAIVRARNRNKLGRGIEAFGAGPDQSVLRLEERSNKTCEAGRKAMGRLEKHSALGIANVKFLRDP